MGGKNGTPLERFQTKYKKQRNGCWIWTAGKTDQGYGTFYFPPQNMVGAHVAAWELLRGPRNGLHVLHICDNPACVNPAHLYLGTHQDNMRDRDSRGRQYDRHGENNGRAKLTTKIVRAIRKDKRWPRFIAKEYRIPLSTVQKIRHGATWRHLL